MDRGSIGELFPGTFFDVNDSHVDELAARKFRELGVEAVVKLSVSNPSSILLDALAKLYA